ANETAAAWRLAVEHDGPTALVLTRQSVPVLERTAELAPDGVARGAYVLADPEPEGDLDLVLVGTGSEVQVCLAAAELLSARDVRARVVSFPSWDRFEGQTPDYQRQVLPPDVPRLAVEAASSFGWERYVDATVTIDRFGASAPGQKILDEFGFTPDHVAAKALDLLADRRAAS
ncbi:MAG: transketolase, partial [Acidimicrobiales bacterium]|nr:transketolase [Acidimicrobiales bacterium]